MTIQRRLGQPAVVYPMQTVTNNRGQEARVVNMDNPISVRAAFVSNTGDAVTMNIDPLPGGLDIGSRVEWDDGKYNVVALVHRNGAVRQTRHWAVELKRTS